jgi:hypothetical protein
MLSFGVDEQHLSLIDRVDAEALAFLDSFGVLEKSYDFTGVVTRGIGFFCICQMDIPEREEGAFVLSKFLRCF